MSITDGQRDPLVPRLELKVLSTEAGPAIIGRAVGMNYFSLSSMDNFLHHEFSDTGINYKNYDDRRDQYLFSPRTPDGIDSLTGSLQTCKIDGAPLTLLGADGKPLDINALRQEFITCQSAGISTDIRQGGLG